MEEENRQLKYCPGCGRTQEHIVVDEIKEVGKYLIKTTRETCVECGGQREIEHRGRGEVKYNG